MVAESQSGAVILPPQAGATIALAGITLTYKTVGAETQGQWLVIEYILPPHFAGPTPHWHKRMTEIFYVLQGTVTFQVGEQTSAVDPGGYAFVPPGAIHRFSNATAEAAKMFIVASPAGMEDYFATLAAMVQQEPQWPPKDMSKVVALMAEYDTFTPAVTK